MTDPTQNALALAYRPVQGAVSQPGLYRTAQPTASLLPFIDSFWQLNVPAGAFRYRSMPDACVDWIFNLSAPAGNVLIAPFVSSRVFPLQGPASYFGVRFRPLGHSAVYSCPLHELSEDVVASDALSSTGLSRLFDALVLTRTFEQRCVEVGEVIAGYTVPISVDRRLSSFLRYCCQHYYLQIPREPLQLSDRQCNEFGLSARQLRRLCNAHLGMGPKQFSRVLRFQSAIRSLAVGRNTNSQRHYCDQSHMIREFNALGGVTPGTFLNMSVLSNTG